MYFYIKLHIVYHHQFGEKIKINGFINNMTEYFIKNFGKFCKLREKKESIRNSLIALII